MIKKRIPILIIAIILFLNIFTFQSSFAQEHRVESSDINVFINNDGSARISEKRKAYLNEGTENYIVIGNLGRSTIVDFQVSEDGRVYEYVDDWDIDSLREEKTFKNGIIDTGNGYELSWGIGEYGYHEYLIEYTVTDFIKEVDDGQILSWRFVNDELNIPPENLTITIESDQAFIKGEEEIYAYGYTGDIQFVDGKIVAKSSKPLEYVEYATVLAILPQGMFETSDILDTTIQEIKEESFIGSDYELEENPGDDGYYDDYDDDYDDNYDNVFDSGPGFFGAISGLFGLFPLAVVGIIFANIFSSKSSNIAGNFKRKFKEEYYRDYPYEGDILDIYYILYKMGVGKFENLLTSFILKWINEDRIMTEIDESGVIFKKEVTNIRFLNKVMDRTTHEGELFNMMLDAAGSNNILEEKEFTKWASKNYSKIEAWEKKVRDDSSMKLQKAGYLTIEEKKKFFFKTQDIVLTTKGEELEERIYKYINYLHDFSLLNEHEAINVKIWDNIMIWAGALGLTEVVSKQFEKLYPRYQAETVYRGNSIYLAHALTRNVARAAVPPSSSSRSGGGGGFSSGGGGGGGSFGGGSGGGTR